MNVQCGLVSPVSKNNIAAKNYGEMKINGKMYAAYLAANTLIVCEKIKTFFFGLMSRCHKRLRTFLFSDKTFTLYISETVHLDCKVGLKKLNQIIYKVSHLK